MEGKKISTKKNRTFTEEFKQEAVNLARKIGNSEAARQLGINETNIRSWKKKQGPQAGPVLKSNVKSYHELEKENKKLQKEIGYLKEINKVLKKSTAIFSSDLLRNSK